MSSPPTPNFPPAFYFPPRDGRYEVAPGLARFGKDFGNGPRDGEVFQIDSDFDTYRRQKRAARRQSLNRYYCTANLADDVAATVNGFVVRRLALEHPAWFTLIADGAAGGLTLACALTGDALSFDAGMRLTGRSSARRPPDPPYASALDALACQVQEDLAIVSGDGSQHWLGAAHVCFPNGWSPRDKIGRDFAGLHEPVPGMESMNRRGGEFAGIMAGAASGLVRFAWGITFDDRLNHHPDEPRSSFEPDRPRAFLRVERQTMWGFPAQHACLFTIRTYRYDLEVLCRDPAARAHLVSAVASMEPQSLAYKNLSDARPNLMAWLADM